MSAVIKTAEVSEKLRARAIDVSQRKILISRLSGSDQESDLQLPANCSGFGRVRHFKQAVSPGWPSNPLPIVPACDALGIAVPAEMTAQVFQNAACAWRCWYCFVPYNLLGADRARSEWFTAEQLVALYAAESDRPKIIDLSGGSPDLVPEWTVWMMEALQDAGLSDITYLWTDDNLSTRYLFDKLDRHQLMRLGGYRNYGRVCCFKGFDADSFRFNTTAAEDGYDKQFAIMKELLALDIDVYGYITLTGPDITATAEKIERLFDRLQSLDLNLPLRVVPLEIRPFAPMQERMNAEREASLTVQAHAIEAWNDNIVRRFSAEERAASISSIALQSKAEASNA